jgi:GNAT superfamily N-acetyltransferase
MREIEVTRTYLQMSEPGQLRSAGVKDAETRIEQAIDCPPSFYRYLYREVGYRYHWIDRLGWSDSEIASHLGSPDISIWIMYHRGSPAGYFELRKCDDASVEIAYFGLLQEFLGRGLGKQLLATAVETAWAGRPSRVWLHTCSLDDPAAMPNYLKRGFTPFKTETYTTSIEAGEEQHLRSV